MMNGGYSVGAGLVGYRRRRPIVARKRRITHRLSMSRKGDASEGDQKWRPEGFSQSSSLECWSGRGARCVPVRVTDRCHSQRRLRTNKKMAALRAKGDEELHKELGELREEHYNLRFQGASGNIQNTSRKRVVRREIARVLTLLGERRAAEETP